MSLPDGNIIYQRNADQILIPASNQKIFVGAIALDILGPSFTFDTHLAIRGPDLVIAGSGDPGLGDSTLAAEQGLSPLSQFEEWAQLLKRHGVTTIRGDILINDSIFDQEWVHPSWDINDLPKWYAAPVGGLNFNDNCIETTLWPTKAGQRVRVEVFPPTDWIEIKNACKTGSENKPWIRRKNHGPTYEIRGKCNQQVTLPSVSVTDPGIFAGEVFRKSLQSHGVTVLGRVRRDAPRGDGVRRPPAEQKILATHQTPFAAVLKRALSDSQNLFAECLMKTLGRQSSSAPGSWEAGRLAMMQKLKAWGIDTGGLVLADGSGLSRDNRASARQLVEVLRHMYLDHQAGHLFINSLSLNADHGTLRKRMKDIPQQVWAKTGYMRGVRSLSGYVRSSNNHWYAFSVIFNNIPGGTAPYNKIHDALCHTLAAPD